MKGYPTIIFSVVIIGLFFISGYRFKDYIIDKNYILIVNVPCNPAIENCFDPDTDWSFDEFPYKKLEILARNAPACLEEHTCEEFYCDGLNQCSITYCSQETVEEGELCLLPITKDSFNDSSINLNDDESHA